MDVGLPWWIMDFGPQMVPNLWNFGGLAGRHREGFLEEGK